jgi:hypothetical protein
LGNALREWLIECLVQSMTATPSRGRELNTVQIHWRRLPQRWKRGIRYRDAIAIEQNPDQIDEIHTASGGACLPSVTDFTSVRLILNKQIVE